MTQLVFEPVRYRSSSRRVSHANEEIIVDNFAGGGGASTGIEAALGRAVDIAINHDREAVEMHKRNHPATLHLCQDVFQVQPRFVTKGRPVGLAWFSPDCKHFSRAKGGKPVEKGIRDLAWVVVKWAKEVRPRVIMLENVPEFVTWGPVCEVTHKPIKERQGETFREWKAALESCGYVVEHRELAAHHYGAPTIRKRFFLVARCDGRAIEWPKPTHGPGLLPYRTAAECIDWSIPCPSIFERPRPLAEKTMRRIARGLKRFVLDAKEPFIVAVNHGGHDCRTGSTLKPLGTLTTKGSFGLVVPYLAHYYGERHEGEVRASNIEAPMYTCTTENRFALVSAFLAKHFGGATGTEATKPLPTTTARGTQTQLVTASLSRAEGIHTTEVRAFLIKYYGNEKDGVSLREPMHTLPCKDRMGLITVHGEDYQIVDIGMRMLTPWELATAQGFPDDYIMTGTKTSQVARIGNSVVPALAEALVRANCADMRAGARRRVKRTARVEAAA